MLNENSITEAAMNAVMGLLKEDQSLIVYRPKLALLTGSVTSAILLSQILYWKNKTHKPAFYKFNAACTHNLYVAGDSWQEELGFSEDELATARNRIATKIVKGVSKTDALRVADANGNLQDVKHLVVYWTDADRLTWYQVNEPLLKLHLLRVYSPSFLDKPGIPDYLEEPEKPVYLVTPDSRFISTETTSETTSDKKNLSYEKRENFQDLEVKEKTNSRNANAGTGEKNAAHNEFYLTTTIKENTLTPAAPRAATGKKSSAGKMTDLEKDCLQRVLAAHNETTAAQLHFAAARQWAATIEGWNAEHIAQPIDASVIDEVYQDIQRNKLKADWPVFALNRFSTFMKTRKVEFTEDQKADVNKMRLVFSDLLQFDKHMTDDDANKVKSVLPRVAGLITPENFESWALENESAIKSAWTAEKMFEVLQQYAASLLKSAA